MRVAEMHPGPEGYLLLFAWVFAEQVGLPLPAAPALLAAGALAAGGSLNLFLLVGNALAASVLADYLWYRAASLGSDAISRFLRRHPGSRVLRRAERLFARYGNRSLLFAKFVPGLSLAAPPLSGLCGMVTLEFLLFDSLGSLMWSGGFAGIGYFFGSAIARGSLVTGLLCAWICVAVTLAFASIGLVHHFKRKLSPQAPSPLIAEFMSRDPRSPAELLWLACLITGDTSSGIDTVVETLCPDDYANPLFARWIATWSRKLVIAKALGKVSAELKSSAFRTAYARQARRQSLPEPEWSHGRPVNKVQLQRALAAIEVFPRCALLLMTFERLSLEDTVILLDADRELVTIGQVIGLTELARNLAYEQGWEASAPAEQLMLQAAEETG